MYRMRQSFCYEKWIQIQNFEKVSGKRKTFNIYFEVIASFFIYSAVAFKFILYCLTWGDFIVLISFGFIDTVYQKCETCINYCQASMFAINFSSRDFRISVRVYVFIHIIRPTILHHWMSKRASERERERNNKFSWFVYRRVNQQSLYPLPPPKKILKV